MKHQPSYAPTYEIPLRQTKIKKKAQTSLNNDTGVDVFTSMSIDCEPQISLGIEGISLLGTWVWFN